MILFTVDANFIDEMKIGRQFPGLMKFYNKIFALLILTCSKCGVRKHGFVNFRSLSIWQYVLKKDFMDYLLFS